MNVENIEKFQTVSIWITRDGAHCVRGYYRGCSYPLSSHTSLQDAFDAAILIRREQHAIGVVPSDEPGGPSDGA